MEIAEFLPHLKIYHATVSSLGAFAAVMTMQIVGQEWTTSYRNATLQWIQRFGLLVLSITLFCSAVRMPARPSIDIAMLLSASSINTAILIIMLPTALMGHKTIHSGS